MPLFADLEAIGAPLSGFFAAVGAIGLLMAGAAIAAIFRTVRDQTSRWAERILGGVLLAVLSTGFLCVLAVVLAILLL